MRRVSLRVPSSPTGAFFLAGTNEVRGYLTPTLGEVIFLG